MPQKKIHKKTHNPSYIHYQRHTEGLQCTPDFLGVCAGTCEPIRVDDQLGPVGRLTLHTCVHQFLQRLQPTQNQEAFVQSKTAAKGSTAVLAVLIHVGQFQAELILCTVLAAPWL